VLLRLAICQHTILTRQGINYGRKKFYNTVGLKLLPMVGPTREVLPKGKAQYN